MQVSHTKGLSSASGERILSSLVAGFVGTELPEHTREALSLGLGGVVILRRNVVGLQQLDDLTGEVRDANPSALVMIDEEGGAVTRLGAIHGEGIPSAYALGHIGDVGLTRDIAAFVGHLLRISGIDLCLAPVADLRRYPENPVVGTRSFGSDPAEVSAHVVSVIEGLHSQGVAACVKHFPGHGATTVDSHEGTARSGLEPDVIRTEDLRPFVAAVAAGVDAVMAGHIVVDDWDAAPVSMSGFSLGNVLRHELGFGGAILCDAVDMKGAGDATGSVVSASLGAGADLVLLGAGDHTLPEIESVVDRVVQDVESGTISLSDATETPRPTLRGVRSSAAAPSDRRLEAARRAMSWNGPAPDHKPVDGVVVLEPEWAPGLAAGDTDLARSFRRAFPDTEIVVAGSDAERVSGSNRVRESGEGRWVVSVNDSVFFPELVDFVNELHASHHALVVAETGVPSDGLHPPTLVLRGAGAASVMAAATALDGTERDT